MKKLSARNQLAGKVLEVRKGQTTSHVRIDIGNGVVVTSAITNEAVDDLAIAERDEVRCHQGFRRYGRKVTRTMVIAAVIGLAALTVNVSRSEPTATPVLQGSVQQRLVLDDTLLKSLPAVSVDVTFETGEGKKSGHYTGVLLWSLIQKAGLVDEPGKNSALKHTLMVTGRDGYAVALAVGELDPHYEGKSVIVAYAGGEPPASNVALRLVVPGDLRGGRSVRDVSTIEVR